MIVDDKDSTILYERVQTDQDLLTAHTREQVRANELDDPLPNHFDQPTFNLG